MRRLTLLCKLFVLLALPLTALAQRTTGDIRGVVTDESGAVLPGVTVTLRGPGVPGAPTTVTNESGIYRFPNLPPGTYQVSAELQGFATKTQTGIPVGLGATIDVDVRMNVSTQQETVTVVAETPVVDAATTEVATNYNREWVENAPVRRFTFFDLINAAPGVAQQSQTSSRSNAFGSAANENLYLLDGTDFTAPLSGAAWPWPNTDAIEEVQSLSLGASAEYGNVAGAVFNIVTRQGSNQFRGDTNIYYQNSGLTGRNTTDAQDGGQPYNRARFVDSTTQLGGPVVKDKLWFFGSFQFQQDWESPAGDRQGVPGQVEREALFLEVQLLRSTRIIGIQFQQHDDFYEIPERATPNKAPSTINLNHGHNPSPGLDVIPPCSIRRRWSRRGTSGFYGIAHNDPLNGGPRINRRFQDLRYGQHHRRHLLLVRRQVVQDRLLRQSHEIRRRLPRRAARLQGGRAVQQRRRRVGERLQRLHLHLRVGAVLRLHAESVWSGGRLRGIGIYVDDTIRCEPAHAERRAALRLEQGLLQRFPILDRNANEIGQSQAVDKLFDWNVISPRLGATFKLNDAGTTLIKGSWGRYYRGIVTRRVRPRDAVDCRQIRVSLEPTTPRATR